MSGVLSRAGFRRMLLGGFLPASVLLAALAALGVRGGVPLEVLTRDPLAVAGRPAYVGILSNLGVLLWCAAASTCFFTCAALGRSRYSAFLLYSGALSAVLMLDDLFMLHEDVFPNGLGMSERRVIAAYGILAAAYVAAFGRTILATRWHALPLTGACFGLSVAVDAGWIQLPGGVFLEDAAKFLGIAGWCAYLCSTCAAAIRSPLLVARMRELLDAALAEESERLNGGAAGRAAELAVCLSPATTSVEAARPAGHPRRAPGAVSADPGEAPQWLSDGALT